MADGIKNNIFLVNAPAGSGKTTWIRHQVEKYLLKNPNDNILCITYTNRAAEELGKDLESTRVYFGTIHSFINNFISGFFSHTEIVDLYLETYKDKIRERIENVKQDSNWSKSNEKYKEKYGSVDLETIRSNIETISYNEAPYTSLYRGALGHDDLISFTKIIIDRFPVIRKKIANKYQLIFIDEYQDTSADILHIFYTAVVDTQTKLYLLGDKMQQIYRNYNGEFEEKFNTFDRSINLSINYRTTPKIVSILNAIYNDDILKQSPYEENSDDVMDFMPKVVIVSDMEKSVNAFRKEYNDVLVLYLSNKSRFHSIGVGELYDAYHKMEKYKYGRKYSEVDVLTKEDARSNDALLTFLFIVDQLIREYKLERYGEVIRDIRRQHIYLNAEKYVIRAHSDKKIIKALIETIVLQYDDRTTTIDIFLKKCVQEELVKSEVYNAIYEDPDYRFVKDVSIQEVKRLVDYLMNPKVSTQHGVKGESHDTVLIVADNSINNPPVNMTKFFELWSNIDITLSEFDAFYYAYSDMRQTIEKAIGMKCSELKAYNYSSVSGTIDCILQAFISKYAENPYYVYLLKTEIDNYNVKKNVTNVKKCLKEGIVYGPLCAYRLFYVGCSRARKNLAIMIRKNEVADFESKLRSRLKWCGFEVV